MVLTDGLICSTTMLAKAFPLPASHHDKVTRALPPAPYVSAHNAYRGVVCPVQNLWRMPNMRARGSAPALAAATSPPFADPTPKLAPASLLTRE